MKVSTTAFYIGCVNQVKPSPTHPTFTSTDKITDTRQNGALMARRSELHSDNKELTFIMYESLL